MIRRSQLLEGLWQSSRQQALRHEALGQGEPGGRTEMRPVVADGLNPVLACTPPPPTRSWSSRAPSTPKAAWASLRSGCRTT